MYAYYLKKMEEKESADMYERFDCPITRLSWFQREFPTCMAETYHGFPLSQNSLSNGSLQATLSGLDTPVTDFRKYKTIELHVRSPYEPRHDKTNKLSVLPTKTQISLGIHPVW